MEDDHSVATAPGQDGSEENEKGNWLSDKLAAAQEHAPDGPPEPDNSAAQKNLERPSAEEIYQQVARNAKQELKRRSVSLAVSGFTGGTFMGFSALGVGIVLAMLGTGPGAFLLSRMLYPLGFIVVIIGRSQLFTENTLYPVALVLAEKKGALEHPSPLGDRAAFQSCRRLCLRFSDWAHARSSSSDCSCDRTTWSRSDAESCRHRFLVSRDGRLDYRHSCLDGVRFSLCNRLSSLDLVC